MLEKSKRVAVVPASFGWRDVGAFSALFEEAEHDENNNAIFGNVLTEATANSYLRSEGPILATIGVKDLIVIVTKDAVLVADKKHDQAIRRIVERLSALGDDCV